MLDDYPPATQILWYWLITFVVTAPSIFLVLQIERIAENLLVGDLPRWRRLMIPLPIVIFLVANLSSVLSFVAYTKIHFTTSAARWSGYELWSSEGVCYAGLVAATILPFLLVKPASKAVGLLLFVWMGHFFWLICPFAILLLATGVPFNQS